DGVRGQRVRLLLAESRPEVVESGAQPFRFAGSGGGAGECNHRFAGPVNSLQIERDLAPAFGRRAPRLECRRGARVERRHAEVGLSDELSVLFEVGPHADGKLARNRATLLANARVGVDTRRGEHATIGAVSHVLFVVRLFSELSVVGVLANE